MCQKDMEMCLLLWKSVVTKKVVRHVKIVIKDRYVLVGCTLYYILVYILDAVTSSGILKARQHCFYKNFKPDHVQCLGGSPGHCTSQHRPAPALHMLSFENFVNLSELKVTPSFCFAFKIPDDVAASNVYRYKTIESI